MSSTTTAADQTTMVSARDSPATSIGGGHYDNVPAALPLAAHYKSLSAAHEPAHSDVYSDGLPDDD